ncbi:MAG: PAS domain S-box protein [Chloroflexi bacterium]|nr:PAS domain S-box protein [Chloroflexota bacterium]
MAMPDVEERLRSALDNMLEGCQIIDRRWRYVYLNDAAARQGRRPKADLLGHTMMEMYPGIEKTELFEKLRESMIERVSHHLENEFVFPDGSRGWFELRVQPVPEGILILSVDITEHKRLDEEMKKYRQRLEDVVARRTAEIAEANARLTEQLAERASAQEGLSLRAAILDNAREAIFLITTGGDFLYANEAACKTYGFSHDEFLRMNLRQLLRPQDEAVIRARLEEVTLTGRLEVEWVHLRRDGSLMPVQVRHSLICTPQGEFIVSVIRDFTRESLLRSVLEQMPGILLSADAQLRLTLSTGAGLQAIGLKPGNGSGVALSDYLESIGFGNAALAAFENALDGSIVPYKVRNQKHQRLYEGSAGPLHDARGELVGVVGVMLESAEGQP